MTERSERRTEPRKRLGPIAQRRKDLKQLWWDSKNAGNSPLKAMEEVIAESTLIEVTPEFVNILLKTFQDSGDIHIAIKSALWTAGIGVIEND